MARANARAQRSLGAAGADGPAHDQALATARRTRDRMQGFVNERGLEVGDAVRMPKGLPHGLMHGVRVLELQTPTYERAVLAAGARPAPGGPRSTRGCPAGAAALDRGIRAHRRR